MKNPLYKTMKLACCTITTSLLLTGFTATISFADCDDMGEGIPYACEETITTKLDIADNRLDSEALMAEGISYQDAVVDHGNKVIHVDNHQDNKQSLENIYCEGPAYSSDAS